MNGYPFPNKTLDPQIVNDGIVNWDIGRAYFDDEAIKYTNSGSNVENRIKTYAVFAWVDVDDYIRMQKVILGSRRGSSNDGMPPGVDPGEYRFNWGVTGYNRPDVDKLKELMRQGNVFYAFHLLYDYGGFIKDEQEGRRRSVAAKELGVKKVPVWFFIEKKFYKDKGFVFMGKYPVTYLKSVHE